MSVDPGSITERGPRLFQRKMQARPSALKNREPPFAMTDIVLSIVMLAALALLAGAVVLWRRTGEVKNPALMVLLAAIAVVNVMIWTLPQPGGQAPIEQIKAAGEG